MIKGIGTFPSPTLETGMSSPTKILSGKDSTSSYLLLEKEKEQTRPLYSMRRGLG
jgi:hypothetical protein